MFSNVFGGKDCRLKYIQTSKYSTIMVSGVAGFVPGHNSRSYTLTEGEGLLSFIMNALHNVIPRKMGNPKNILISLHCA